MLGIALVLLLLLMGIDLTGPLLILAMIYPVIILLMISWITWLLIAWSEWHQDEQNLVLGPWAIAVYLLTLADQTSRIK